MPFIEASYALNRCQLVSFDPETMQQPEDMTTVGRFTAIEESVANTKAIIQHRKRRAYYVPSLNKIYIAAESNFVSTSAKE